MIILVYFDTIHLDSHRNHSCSFTLTLFIPFFREPQFIPFYPFETSIYMNSSEVYPIVPLFIRFIPISLNADFY